MLMVLLFACQERVPESYPDAWTAASEVCEEPYGLSWSAAYSPPSDECLLRVEEDLGDPDDVIATEVAMLARFKFDPWLYDMLAHNVDHVEFNWMHLHGDDSVAASYSDDDTRTVTVYSLLEDPIMMLMVAVHEAGHGRPNAPEHEICDYGPAKGTESCDRNLEGAHGASFELLAQIHYGEDAELGDSVEWLRHYVSERIEW